MKKVLRIALLLLALFVLVGVSLAFFRPSSIITKKDARERFKLEGSHFLRWGGGEVHYVDEGSGYPILMIHGLAGSHRNFGKIADRLKKDYRVIRVDLPGFGLSDVSAPPDNDYRRLYLEFFDFFIDTLQLDSFYLMGNSMGGWMSWEIAVRHPERVQKLFLMCSAGYDMRSIADKLSSGMNVSTDVVEAIASRGIPEYFTRKNIENCFADPSRVNADEVTMANCFANRETNFSTIVKLLKQRRDADTSLIQTIQCPTLIVWGAKDNIIPVNHAQRFHRDVPNNKLIIYEDCGHIPMVEQVDQFEKDFRAFVTETNSTTQGTLSKN